MMETFTVGDRTYEILTFLREGEVWLVGHTMVERAKKMNAHLGEEEGRYLLDNQQDIPTRLRGKVRFVFTDWCYEEQHIGYIWWNSVRWMQSWCWLGSTSWNGNDQVLRRTK